MPKQPNLCDLSGSGKLLELGMDPLVSCAGGTTVVKSIGATDRDAGRRAPFRGHGLPGGLQTRSCLADHEGGNRPQGLGRRAWRVLDRSFQHGAFTEATTHRIQNINILYVCCPRNPFPPSRIAYFSYRSSLSVHFQPALSPTFVC